MASSSLVATTAENKVLNFKQKGGENLKMLGIGFVMLIIDQHVSNPPPSFFTIFMWALLLGIDLYLTLLPEEIN